MIPLNSRFTSLGVISDYSHESQQFLTALNGYSLDKARFPNHAVFQQYTNAPCERAKQIVESLGRFITESDDLLNSPPFYRNLSPHDKDYLTFY